MSHHVSVDPGDDARVDIGHLEQGRDLRVPGTAIDPDHFSHPPARLDVRVGDQLPPRLRDPKAYLISQLQTGGMQRLLLILVLACFPMPVVAEETITKRPCQQMVWASNDTNLQWQESYRAGASEAELQRITEKRTGYGKRSRLFVLIVLTSFKCRNGNCDGSHPQVRGVPSQFSWCRSSAWSLAMKLAFLLRRF